MVESVKTEEEEAVVLRITKHHHQQQEVNLLNLLVQKPRGSVVFSKVLHCSGIGEPIHVFNGADVKVVFLIGSHDESDDEKSEHER